jgi:DNA-binding CsgD family transcriptional regulator
MNILEFSPRARSSAQPHPGWMYSPAPTPEPAADTCLSLLVEGLDHLAHGVALLGVDSSVHYANQAARALFRQAGWQCDERQLRSPRTGEGEAWRSALRQVVQQGRRQLYELACDQALHYIALAPVTAGGRTLIFVTCGRRELCGQPELQMYATRRGLTGAENQVLVKLADGLKPAQIAQAHGVALSTVLTQVAAVRSKTMSASIRHLLGTLSRLPPLRPLLG